MTKIELDNWIKSAKYVTCAQDYYDDNTNHYVATIYEKNGELFQIEFCNGHPYEKWGGKGFIRGEYSIPRKVKKVTRMVEQTEYEII